MRIDIISIFPEYFAPLGVSLIGKAVQRGDIAVAVHDLRDWAHDPHRTVDDTPFGGGPGMVMKPEPWGEALDAVVGHATGPRDQHPAEQRGADQHAGGQHAPEQHPAEQHPAEQHGADQHVPEEHAAEQHRGGQHAGEVQLIVPTPSGVLFTQRLAAELARSQHLVFACGRYEGIDERVVEYARSKLPVRELSIGDYVLAGGEPAVLVMIEAISRLIPGVLGNASSAPDDSFGAGDGPMDGLVEGPAYTRPRTWRDLDVPEVLLSGDHGAIARWRRDQSLAKTIRNRPDLAARAARGVLDVRDRQVLSEAGFAVSGQDVAH